MTKLRKAGGQGHEVAAGRAALPRREGVQPDRRGGRNIAASSRFIPANRWLNSEKSTINFTINFTLKWD